MAKNGFSEKKSLENVEPKFLTLECGVLESNRFDFWNQHSRISLETKFQGNQNMLRVFRFLQKYHFLTENSELKTHF